MPSSYQKINFDDSTWPAAKKALLKKLKFEQASPNEANLIWSDCQWPDNTADPKWINSLTKNQSINYFPEASETFRKDTLTENINRYANKYPEIFKDVLPKSWNLPKQYSDFKKYLELQKSSNNRVYFIVKENDEQRGVGIYITDQPEKDLTPESDVVVSKYIGNPLLVDGCKFDFRVHVLVASLEPFTVYVHEEALMRMASVPYEKPTVSNRDNMYMHLTNLSLNKNNENSIFELMAGDSLLADDSKGKLARSFSHFRSCLKEMGQDDQKVVDEMDHLIGKVLVCCYDDLKKNYESRFGKINKSISKSGAIENSANQCFQVLGFDIMFDEYFKPWFIEVNHNPDFVDDPKIASLLMRKTVVDTIEKMSEINKIEFKETELTGDTSYDVVYAMPNQYRKVDVEAIYTQLRSKATQTLGDSMNYNLSRKDVMLSELVDVMYKKPYQERRSRIVSRPSYRDN